MGKRSTSRRLAMQALFEAEHSTKDIHTSLENVFSHEDYLDETKTFAKELACGVFSKKSEIDALIVKYSIDWSLERMGGVDRNILRLSIYEIREGKTPLQVVINEAVELAKKYSSNEAAKFINGILGAYIKDR